jgi:hypothetical protein
MEQAFNRHDDFMAEHGKGKEDIKPEEKNFVSWTSVGYYGDHNLACINIDYIHIIEKTP